MSNVPPDPFFPAKQYYARYELGFETDREYVGLTAQAWDFVYEPVENFILCNPHLSSWEIEGSDGARFLVTTDVPFLDLPPLIIYFKPFDSKGLVSFLSIERGPATPDYVDSEDHY